MTDEKRVNRRVINKAIGGGVLAVLTGGAYVAENEGYTNFVGERSGSKGGGTPEKKGYQPGEMYDWDSVEKCLSSDQEESVSEVVGRYDNLSRNDLGYSVETDGNVVMHRPSKDGYKPVAETRDNDFMCDINY
ncbi:MAG: hypothetical protein ABEJ87_05945 [Candidatus Nanohalobium sp.]